MPGKFFPRNKLGPMPFCFADTATQNVPHNIVVELISKQQWLRLRTHLETTTTTITSPTTVLQQLFDSGADTELVLRYFDWSRREFKVKYTLELICRLLHSLAAAKMYLKIRNLLNGFVKDESFCSVSVSSIFRAFSSCGGDHDRSRIADMLMVAYVKNMRPHLGFEAFKRAGEYGLKLSVVSCNHLLNALVKGSEIVGAEYVYKEMRNRKIELDLVSFNIVIHGLCKVGKLKEASDVIEDMKSLGVSPDAITYNTLIDGYCKRGKIGRMYRADAILKDMVESGIPADEFTFNILIDGFCKDRNVLAAMKVFDEMKNQGVKVSLITYSSLINGLCACGKLDEAIALRNQMITCSGLKPDFITHSVIIKGFCKQKMVDRARELFDDLVKQGMVPNVVMYNTMIDAYCKSRRTEDAFALHDSMLERGMLPNAATYNSLIAGLCSEGDTEGAKRLENVSKNKGLIKADLVTY
ncbi:hypothetical protein JRO89_XS03G0323700 [Xanthoceras sorbifolium]|uniref:Pentatricopeptide repeat-containing protein n=1 Tax=Xanthoceras sorbifolium TaxID=99658 RepID=A0ABQ8IDJ1_9ROSI|nr:hypothetical protein JRO89_XS03G0323700 [Xanthoceras sorbifolium]